MLLKFGAAPWPQIGARYRENTSRRTTHTQDDKWGRTLADGFSDPLKKKKLFERIGKSNADFSETFMVDLQVVMTGVEQNRI